MPGDSFNGSFTSSGSGGFVVTSCGRALNNERSGYVEKSKRHTPQRTGELASSWPLVGVKKTVGPRVGIWCELRSRNLPDPRAKGRSIAARRVPDAPHTSESRRPGQSGRRGCFLRRPTRISPRAPSGNVAGHGGAKSRPISVGGISTLQEVARRVLRDLFGIIRARGRGRPRWFKGNPRAIEG